MTIIDRFDGVNSGAAIKVPCACATTGNITLSGLQTIDGLTLLGNERVLVKNQTDSTQNGIYVASSSAWIRAKDFDGANDIVTGTMVFVAGGVAQDATDWYVSTANDPVPGTNFIAFTQITSTTGGAGPAGPQGPQGASGSIPIVAAGGTANAITATYSPPITLTDTTLCAVVAGAPNTSTTPTFAPNALAAHTITKYGGQPLVNGDIAGAGHTLILEYNSANTRWELLNPAVTLTTLGAAKLAGGNVFSGAQRGGITALASSSGHIATDLSLNNSFSHTFTENTILDNPANANGGQSGCIYFTQNASSPKTLSLGANWKAAGGFAQTVTATVSAQDTLYYNVRDATHIEYNIVKGNA